MPVHVRQATIDDAKTLCTLWADLAAPAREPLGDSLEVVVEKAVLRYTDGDAEGRILVAEIDGSVVGCGFLRVALASPLDDGGVVHLSHVQVASGWGRQGVGSALVEASLTWAEQQGVPCMVTSVPASHREANRFLARLGMAPVASIRGGAVATLRARLPHGPSAAARQNGRAVRSVGQVVAARRSQRRARARSVAP